MVNFTLRIPGLCVHNCKQAAVYRGVGALHSVGWHRATVGRFLFPSSNFGAAFPVARFLTGAAARCELAKPAMPATQRGDQTCEPKASQRFADREREWSGEAE